MMQHAGGKVPGSQTHVRGMQRNAVLIRIPFAGFAEQAPDLGVDQTNPHRKFPTLAAA